MKRVRALQEELARSGMTAALVVSPENVRYLTGFYVWNSVAPFAVVLIPSSGDPVLLVPRSDDALARAVSRVPVRAYDPGPQGFKTTAAHCQAALGHARSGRELLALEFGAITLDRVRLLEEAFAGWTFTDLTEIMARFRIVKDEVEQRSLRQAGELLAVAFRQVAASVRPGMSEVDVKGAIDLAVCADGARRWPEEIIQSQANVLSGPGLTRLHDASTGRTLHAGEMVFVLGGASVNGYWANLGRTLFIPGGPRHADAGAVLEVAVRAQQAAMGRLAPGIPLGEAIRAADHVLTEAEWIDHKTYPVFRGLGLRIDERPGAWDAGTTLRPGMCLCAQLYLRHPEFILGQSDSVLVTENGAEVLSAPSLDP
ncbi:MAG: M24 family metallopeptidase [Armatimonadota bacterium]